MDSVWAACVRGEKSNSRTFPVKRERKRYRERDASWCNRGFGSLHRRWLAAREAQGVRNMRLVSHVAESVARRTSGVPRWIQNSGGSGTPFPL